MKGVHIALYNYDKRLSAAERKIENAAYSENSKKLILRFEKFLFVEGLSKARVIKYLSQMNAVAEWANFELDSATKEDIEYIVGLVARSELADWKI